MDYALTPLGRSLAEALIPLCGWGEKNSDKIASVLPSVRRKTQFNLGGDDL